MNIKAYFRKSNSSVYVRVRDGRNVDYRVPTGMYIDQTHFDPSVPGYSKKSDAPQEVKDEFNKQLADLLLLVSNAYHPGVTLDYMNHVVSSYFDGTDIDDAESSEVVCEETQTKGKETFFDLFDEYLRQKEANGKPGVDAYRAIYRRLQRYETWQREMEGRNDFTLSTETFGAGELESYMRYVQNEYCYFVEHPDFFSRFEVYRSTMRPSSANSACSGGTRVKAFLNWCRKQGCKMDLSFQAVSTKHHVYGTPYYLTIEERDKVLEREMGFCKSIQLIRDMFVFQCMVGCRIGDLFTLTRDNIQDGWLCYIPGKNLHNNKTEVVRVPLLDKAQDILARYPKYSPRLFPAIDTAKYNMGIRFVLEICGINRQVPYLNPLTREMELLPLYEVASSHTARKTFIGNIYRHVKDQALVASLTGHASNSRAFARYREIGDDIKREVIELIK
jgi:integrase